MRHPVSTPCRVGQGRRASVDELAPCHAPASQRRPGGPVRLHDGRDVHATKAGERRSRGRP